MMIEQDNTMDELFDGSDAHLLCGPCGGTGKVLDGEECQYDADPVAYIRHHPNGNKELVWSMDWRFDKQDHTPLFASPQPTKGGK